MTDDGVGVAPLVTEGRGDRVAQMTGQCGDGVHDVKISGARKFLSARRQRAARTTHTIMPGHPPLDSLGDEGHDDGARHV